MDLTLNTLPAAAVPVASTTAPTTKRLWTGRVLSGLVTLFLLFDAGAKLARPPMVIQGTLELGYPVGTILPLGIVLLACVALYLIPRTALLGAVLLTGYLGGAIASHVRLGQPLFSHTLFPVYVAALIWGGLYLRDARAASLLAPPARRRA